MAFFARRNGSAADQDFAMGEADAVQGAIIEAQTQPPPAMADAMLRRFTGMSFADVQGAAAEAGQMLAGYKESLERIESALVLIAARLEALENRRKQ